MAKEAHKNGIAFDSYQQYADDIENNCIPLIEQYFNCLRTSIASKDYSDYKSLFFRLEKLPDFFCCVLGFPFFDFDKNDLSFSFLTLSIVVSADSRSGYMALTWNRMATHIDSFISSWQRHNYNFNFMLSFIFSCEHNYYFSPQWWMALTYEKQKRITEFAMLPYRIEVCKQFNTSLRDLFYGIYEKFSDEKMIFSGVTTGSPVEI